MEALRLGALRLSSLGSGHGYGWGGSGRATVLVPLPRPGCSAEHEELVQCLLGFKVFKSKPFCYAVASKEATQTRLPKERKKGLTGIFRSYTLSPELGALVGEDNLSRVEVSKRLWEYIRKNNLQDPDNRKKILCNEELRSLFGTDVTDIFQMNKLLSKHIATPEKPPGEKKPKGTKASRHVKGLKPSGLLTPQSISEELQTFLGLSEAEVSRPKAVKLVWKYIKENNLQDPENKRKILCDEKLHELLKCESFEGFYISRYLSPHFVKRL